MTERPSPEDLAHLIAKRPGMFVGEASYERAHGFLTGLSSLVATLDPQDSSSVCPDEFSVERRSDLLGRTAAVERDPAVNDREAILQLESLFADAITQLQQSIVAHQEQKGGTHA